MGYIVSALFAALVFAIATGASQGVITFFVLAFVISLLLYLAFFTDPRVQLKANWRHFFDNQSISTKEFFTLIKQGLKEQNVGVDISEPSMTQSHIFSAKRVYLRLAESDLVFYVCVAPFGTGTFVSWWECETEEGIINRIPVLSKLLGKDRKNKTFFQMDTAAMYKSVIHSTVLAAVDFIGNANGMRTLSEFERQYTDPR